MIRWLQRMQGIGRFAAAIGLGKILDYFLLKSAFVIEDVMRDAEPLGDARGVMDILTGAAGALAPQRRAMVVKLQGDADHLEPALDQQRGSDRRVDPARHRHDDPVIGGISRQIDVV